METKERGIVILVDQTDEKELVMQAKNGEDDAFSTLFRLHYPFLYQYVLKSTLHPDLIRTPTKHT